MIMEYASDWNCAEDGHAIAGHECEVCGDSSEEIVRSLENSRCELLKDIASLSERLERALFERDEAREVVTRAHRLMGRDSHGYAGDASCLIGTLSEVMEASRANSIAASEAEEAVEVLRAIVPMLRRHAEIGDQLWREDQIAAMDSVAIEIVRVLHQSKVVDRLSGGG